MTNEEAIKVIKANYPSGWYEDLRQALDMSIRALEQETVLDRIRDEIDGAEMPKNQMSFFRDGIDCALQIINKYKAEREYKE